MNGVPEGLYNRFPETSFEIVCHVYREASSGPVLIPEAFRSLEGFEIEALAAEWLARLDQAVLGLSTQAGIDASQWVKSRRQAEPKRLRSMRTWTMCRSDCAEVGPLFARISTAVETFAAARLGDFGNDYGLGFIELARVVAEAEGHLATWSTPKVRSERVTALHGALIEQVHGMG